MEAGTLRSDVEPDDVLVGLSGVSLATTDLNRRKQADLLLDVVMDGLRVHR